MVELAVVVAIIGILATVAGAGFEAARRNAQVGSTAFDVSLQLRGLKTRAMNEQRDYVFIVVNPPGDVSTNCGAFSQNNCLRWFLISDTTSSWTLGGFDPEDPTDNAALVDYDWLPAGVVLDLSSAGAALAAPFNQVRQLDASVLGSCSGRNCIAVQFGADGETSPVYSGSSTPIMQGVAFGLSSDAAQQTSAAEHRALMVSIPTGIVKTFTY